MSITRRDLLERGVYLGTAVLIGCDDSTITPGTPPPSSRHPDATAGNGDATSNIDAGFVNADAQPIADSGFADSGQAGTPDAGFPDAGQPACPDPLMGATQDGTLRWSGEGRTRLNTPFNVGWDGRLYTDLSVITPENQIIPNEHFYIRTRYPDLIDENAAWEIRVRGLTGTQRELSMSDIEPMVQDQGTFVLECSGNGRGGSFGLLSAAQWSGAKVEDVFATLNIDASATRVEIAGFDGHSVPSAGGHSTPGASWIFSFDQLYDAGAFFATRMNGEALPRDHGFPVRLYVPNWYGCTNIKWVDEIRFVDDDAQSTSQMREFSSRTHQRGTPRMARDFIPATMDQTAMPVRVEKWRLGSQVVYNIVGIMWGGYEPTDALTISFDFRNPEPVDVCPTQTQNSSWTVWQHVWQPNRTGTYSVTMGIDDASITTRRLDRQWYLREVVVDEV